MIVVKKAIPRREVLRGIGVTLALPFLDSMVPALTAQSRTAARATQRFGVFYVPNGVVMDQWTPAVDGDGFEFSPSLRPLAAFRDQLQVLTGLTAKGTDNIHETGATAFLTGVAPRRTQGSQLYAGASIDQLLARQLGPQTQLASLELALESGDDVGTCGAGYTCAYTNTICWRGPTTPLPMEINPRVVFERLLGDTGSTDAGTRLARAKSDRSLLDAVLDKISTLGRSIGAGDRHKLGEYLESVRDIERRLQAAEAQVDQPLPDIEQPIGVPAVFEDHAALMFDLQVLAYQCDLTRVITFMLSREYSGRTYPQIGVPDAHHPTSHHQGDPVKLEKLAKINAYHATMFAQYLDKLRSTPDGDGSLLDHITILYGCGISESNSHSSENLPVLLAGGGAGRVKKGTHVRYSGTTPMANLHVTLLDRYGVAVDTFGRSTGALDLPSAI